MFFSNNMCMPLVQHIKKQINYVQVVEVIDPEFLKKEFSLPLPNK